MQGGLDQEVAAGVSGEARWTAGVQSEVRARAWHRLLADRVAVGSGLVLLILGVMAVTAPVLAPQGPFRTSTQVLTPPSPSAPMGTDDLGRSVLVGVLYGAQTSLLVGMSVGLLAGLLGLGVGGVSGFVGGVVDDVLMRLAEFTMVLPRFFLAIATAALFGSRIVPLIVLLGLITWPGPARVLRSAVLSQRHLPYVEAARGIGTKPSRILLRHVLPNAVTPFIVSITLLCGGAILIEAGLAFLGLSDSSTPSWGTMLRDAEPLMIYAPWAVLFPAVAVTLAVLSFNLFGDGLLEALAPVGVRGRAGRPS